MTGGTSSTANMTWARLPEGEGNDLRAGRNTVLGFTNVVGEADALIRARAEAAALKHEEMSVILCTAGYDHTIRFWEALSGICSRTIQHPESQVNRLCITPDKKFLAAAGRHNVKLYDIRSTNSAAIMTFEGHTSNITGVAFHCEGKWMVTSSEDSTVKVWDTRSGSLQRNYTHDHPVHDVVIHPNQGELISGDRGGSVRVWDLGENRCTHQLIPEEDIAVASVSVASDGSLLAAGMNRGNVYLWRMVQNNETTQLIPVTHFSAHKEYLTRVLISPDVKNLATCSADHTAKIWTIDPNEEDLISPEERIARQEQKSLQSAQPSSASINHTLSATTNAFNPFGTILQKSFGASHPNGTHNPEPISQTVSTASEPLPLNTTLDQHQRWVWDCAFSADSAYLVTVCSDHYARLWELQSSQIIRQYNGHHRGAVCVALNDYSEPGVHV